MSDLVYGLNSCSRAHKKWFGCGFPAHHMMHKTNGVKIIQFNFLKAFNDKVFLCNEIS